MSEYGYNPEKDEYITPIIEIETSDKEVLQLHWGNSRIRTFAQPQYNHVEYYPDETEKVMGMRLDEEVISYMMTHDYPHLFEPVPDKATENWLVSLETKDLGELAIGDIDEY